MIVAIPVDEKSMDGNVSEHFGRTETFLIFDTKNNKSSFIPNVAVNAQGGAGIKAAQVIVDTRVDALISPRLGKNAFEVIDAANITIYESIGKTIEENIDALRNEKLPPLNTIHEGFHGNGGH